MNCSATRALFGQGARNSVSVRGTRQTLAARARCKFVRKGKQAVLIQMYYSSASEGERLGRRGRQCPVSGAGEMGAKCWPEEEGGKKEGGSREARNASGRHCC